MSVDLKEPALPPALAAVAQRELGETAGVRRDSLREMRRRISLHSEQTDGQLEEKDEQSERFSQSQAEDQFLLRFLRCKKFDVSRSFSAWEGYYKFRRENAGLFSALSPSSVQQVWRSGVLGGLQARDRKGRAVLVAFPGRWEPGEVALEDVLGALVLQLERAIASDETQVHGIVLIADFADFTFSQAMALKPWYFQKMATLIQNAFPARFKGVYIVRQPWYLSIVLSLIRPFLSEKMSSRINILGSDVETLSEHFDLEVLPSELGGATGAYDGYAWGSAMEEGVREEASGDNVRPVVLSDSRSDNHCTESL